MLRAVRVFEMPHRDLAALLAHFKHMRVLAPAEPTMLDVRNPRAHRLSPMVHPSLPAIK